MEHPERVQGYGWNWTRIQTTEGTDYYPVVDNMEDAVRLFHEVDDLFIFVHGDKAYKFTDIIIDADGTALPIMKDVTGVPASTRIEMLPRYRKARDVLFDYEEGLLKPEDKVVLHGQVYIIHCFGTGYVLEPWEDPDDSDD